MEGVTDIAYKLKYCDGNFNRGTFESELPTTCGESSSCTEPDRARITVRKVEPRDAEANKVVVILRLKGHLEIIRV